MSMLTRRVGTLERRRPPVRPLPSPEEERARVRAMLIAAFGEADMPDVMRDIQAEIVKAGPAQEFTVQAELPRRPPLSRGQAKAGQAQGSRRMSAAAPATGPDAKVAGPTTTSHGRSTLTATP